MKESFMVIKQFELNKDSPEFRLLNSIFGFTKKEALSILDRDIKLLDEEYKENPIKFIQCKKDYFENYRKQIKSLKGKRLDGR